MNRAEEDRNERIAKMLDLDLLCVLTAEPRDEALSATEFKAFQDMLPFVRGGTGLSKRQRAWAEEAARRVVPLDSKLVPRGREVPTPDVLKKLPTKPPKRSVP